MRVMMAVPHALTLMYRALSEKKNDRRFDTTVVNIGYLSLAANSSRVSPAVRESSSFGMTRRSLPL